MPEYEEYKDKYPTAEDTADLIVKSFEGYNANVGEAITSAVERANEAAKQVESAVAGDLDPLVKGWIDNQKDVEGGLVSYDAMRRGDYISVDDITIKKSEEGQLSVKDLGISTNKIADKNVTEAKLADNAVTAEKLAPNSVTENSIAEGAVTQNSIAPGAVTESAIAEGAVTAGALASGSVTTDSIAEGAITKENLAEGAITADKLADGAITTDKLSEEFKQNIATTFSVDPVYSELSEGFIGTYTKDTQAPKNTWDSCSLCFLKYDLPNGDLLMLTINHGHGSFNVNRHQKINIFTAAPSNDACYINAFIISDDGTLTRYSSNLLYWDPTTLDGYSACKSAWLQGIVAPINDNNVIKGALVFQGLSSTSTGSTSYVVGFWAIFFTFDIESKIFVINDPIQLDDYSWSCVENLQHSKDIRRMFAFPTIQDKTSSNYMKEDTFVVCEMSPDHYTNNEIGSFAQFTLDVVNQNFKEDGRGTMSAFGDCIINSETVKAWQYIWSIHVIMQHKPNEFFLVFESYYNSTYDKTEHTQYGNYWLVYDAEQRKIIEEIGQELTGRNFIWESIAGGSYDGYNKRFAGLPVLIGDETFAVSACFDDKTNLNYQKKVPFIGNWFEFYKTTKLTVTSSNNSINKVDYIQSPVITYKGYDLYPAFSLTYWGKYDDKIIFVPNLQKGTTPQIYDIEEINYIYIVDKNLEVTFVPLKSPIIIDIHYGSGNELYRFTMISDIYRADRIKIHTFKNNTNIYLVNFDTSLYYVVNSPVHKKDQ